MDLTMAEKRDFLERMRELVLCGVIGREERDEIYKICIAACGNAMSEMKEGSE